jgi:hypothetical protein
LVTVPADFISALERRYFWWEPVFRRMFKADPALQLRALGFFKDGDLALLPEETQRALRAARDGISTISDVSLRTALVG